jgi:hypothetical protein
MERHDCCQEKVLLAASYVIDQTGRQAELGSSRRYHCENCGLWWNKIAIRNWDSSPLCERCVRHREGSRGNRKGYPPLY